MINMNMYNLKRIFKNTHVLQKKKKNQDSFTLLKETLGATRSAKKLLSKSSRGFPRAPRARITRGDTRFKYFSSEE